MLPSVKKIGKYERKLFRVLTSYFESRGFEVSPHIQLNIAWGSIISDVDLVATRDDTFIAIEVKSRRDKFKHAFQQIYRICDFFDRVYIASDKSKRFLEKNWQDKTVGLLRLEGELVTERKDGELLLDDPKHSTLLMLRKICLSRLAQIINGNSRGNKSEIAQDVLRAMDGKHLKSIVRSIVVCNRTCEESCPIWNFGKTLITPLRNIQQIVENYNIPQKTSPPLILAKMLEEENNK